MASKFVRALRAVENSLAFLSIFLRAMILLCEAVARKVFHSGIPDSGIYVEHLVLVATFIAAAITSRERNP